MRLFQAYEIYKTQSGKKENTPESMRDVKSTLRKGKRKESEDL